jgi:hypothetical protein
MLNDRPVLAPDVVKSHAFYSNTTVKKSAGENWF